METTALRELTTVDGSFASVCVDDSHDTADAEKQRELRWQATRAELADLGAPERTLAALDTAATDREPPVGEGGMFLVAAGDRVLVDEELPAPPPRAIARVSRAPFLLPLASLGTRGPRRLVVTVDSVGATITARDARGRELDTGEVRGQDHPVHKVRGAGPGHRTVQARTEETVRHNLKDVADEVVKAAGRLGAGIVVLSGEVQARRGLLDLLPEHIRERTEEVSADATAEDISEAAARHQLARLDQTAEKFRTESGRTHGLAVQGIEAVTTVLREGNAETLLVTEPGDTTVACGPEPGTVAATADELKAYGVDDPVWTLADEALPFAGVATGAALVRSDERLDLADGFGAILRHA
ncbi:Rv2629 family ribosome hibernation factor [Amycolatopsis sp. CA-230715]|uniref:Rv2629 family ribosome hibernation factor n=1 Tax=Amycolatopsis sp. CA-230715 TaxID=2745196 RepID=UPI001C0233E5|nr:hypothetical protein [Amycolatopsis sp. CA-230715]QWF84583.1 hypothetical protein HUW46_08034 [Amycolatopsis sp. CA-230715]